MTYENGEYYEGMFLQNKKEGKGILKMVSGDKYEGMFSNDLMHGFGIYTRMDGEILESEFFEGKQ